MEGDDNTQGNIKKQRAERFGTEYKEDNRKNNTFKD